MAEAAANSKGVVDMLSVISVCFVSFSAAMTATVIICKAKEQVKKDDPTYCHCKTLDFISKY